MDIQQLGTIIVTALITGIAVFYGQKWIESRNQRNNLVYQTKFVRNHEKMVETLDTLYKKFTSFSFKMSKTFNDVAYLFSNPDLPINEIENDVAKHIEDADDFRQYYFNNRIYLSASISKEIQKTVLIQADLMQLAKMISELRDGDNLNVSNVQLVNMYIESYNEYMKTNSIKLLEPTKRSVLLVIGQLREELKNQRVALESLYQSIAGIK